MTHDMHCPPLTLFPLLPLSPAKICRKGHRLLRCLRSVTLYQTARHSNVILAQLLDEVQNCLTELHLPIPSLMPPSQLIKKPFYAIVLLSLPGTLPPPHLLTLLTSSLSSFALSNIRKGGCQELEIPFLDLELIA